MGRTIRNILVTLLASSVCSPSLMAQESPGAVDDGGPPSMRGMTPKERQAIWKTLSEEDKEIVRKRRQAARDKQRQEWEAMTPEEREIRRAENQARLDERAPGWRQVARERQEKDPAGKRNRGAEPPATEKDEAVPAADPES